MKLIDRRAVTTFDHSVCFCNRSEGRQFSFSAQQQRPKKIESIASRVSDLPSKANRFASHCGPPLADSTPLLCLPFPHLLDYAVRWSFGELGLDAPFFLHPDFEVLGTFVVDVDGRTRSSSRAQFLSRIEVFGHRATMFARLKHSILIRGVLALTPDQPNTKIHSKKMNYS